MSNLDIHDSNSSASRRRGGAATTTAAERANMYPVNGVNGDDDDDANKKDYLMDTRPHMSQNAYSSDKEKEKWARLIPQELSGSSSRSSLNKQKNRAIDPSTQAGLVSVYFQSKRCMKRRRVS
jgi:hypothetical protein